MRKILFLTSLMLSVCFAQAQQTQSSNTDSLLNSLTSTNEAEPVIAAFKSTRLILTPTTETNKKKNLNFMVVHRFGDVAGAAGGGKTLYGFDNSSDIYIGFEYGLTDNLDINFGRSKYEQLLELGFKYSLLHQTSNNSMPVALTLLANAGLKPYQVTTNVFDDYTNRLSYFYQAIFSRKFSSRLSLEVAPSFLRDNLPFPYINGNEKNIFALSAAGRFKVTKHMGIVLDYAHPFSSFRRNNTSTPFYDPLGVGIEIETGGHVFTMNFTNAEAISPINYLSSTTSNWAKGQFRFGFNIARVFDLDHKHKGTYK
ncbi:DUF5777 family beta-barrel protein [uncultured Mucilaginibacter sp.]|uniref:DUF5777 family beta-barrel protein n=1 Tax=uncultured Mucilaginibacter sp. TaxID=797541 RepID=UPI002629356C|nr:DUF5777 family beta-barrel protein [uncultured Mucilaginibacter sp.]